MMATQGPGSKHCMTQCGLLFVLVLSAPTCLAQTTYYVASTGNDTDSGLSATTPFQSLNRVNRVGLQPGDKVLFRRGDTFRGTLRVRQSGTAEKPIRFESYGTGTKPVLAGSVPVSNWVKVGPDTWQAPCPDCGNRVTGLYRNGVAQPLGRYPNPDAPNRGNLTVQAHVGMTQLTSQQLLATDWTGADVVVRPTYWIIDRATITKQIGNTFTLSNPSTYQLTDGWGYFIQNHPATLDQPGEWYYNPATQIIRYHDRKDPNGQQITATSTDRVVDMADVAYISLQNLHITQGRTTNLFAMNVRNLTLSNNDFTEAGEDGVVVQGVGNTILIDNNTITEVNNNGVYIGAYTHVTFRRNTLRRVGLLPGRGKSGDGQFTGFQSIALQNTLIENNVIDSVGYIGVSVQNNTTIRQNLIAHFCMTKNDGGGIYLWNGAQLPMQGIQIQSNIIRNGVGTPGSVADTVLNGAHGIFLDDCVEGVDLTDNTITGCHGSGIYMHAVSRVNVLRNTSFDNSVGQLVLYNYDKRCLPRNNTLRGNILIAKSATQPVAGYISGADDLTDFGVMDGNYYARPFNDISTIRAVYNRTNVSDLSLSQWQTRFGRDLTSQSSPITYKDYVVRGLSTVDRFGGSFGGSSAGWETWSVYNNGQANWTAGNQLSGGSVTINFSRLSGQSDSYALAYKRIGAVTKARSYLLRFNAVAPAEKKIVAFIRQRQAPYQDLTRRYEFMAGPTRASYEVALSASADEVDALLTFQLGEDGPSVQLDNIHLQEATVEPINPDDCIRLVYNPATKDSTIILGAPYRDVKNRHYARQITLKPFASVILLRDSLPPADISLSIRADRALLYVSDVVSVSLTLRNASITLPAHSGAVRWACRLPAYLSVVSGPGLVYRDSLLTGTVQRLLADTTFVFWLKATIPGQYALAAQVTAATHADPNSTPNSGTDDGEDDQVTLTLLVREPGPAQPEIPNLVTATETTGALKESQVFPNPASDAFTFVAGDDDVTLRLVDLLGRERLTVGFVRRGQTVRFGQFLPDAQYLLHVYPKSGERRTVKLVKSARQ